MQQKAQILISFHKKNKANNQNSIALLPNLSNKSELTPGP